MQRAVFVMISNFHPTKEVVTQPEVAREQDLTVNRVHLASSPAKEWNPCPSQPHMAGRMLPFTSWDGGERGRGG